MNLLVDKKQNDASAYMPHSDTSSVQLAGQPIQMGVALPAGQPVLYNFNPVNDNERFPVRRIGFFSSPQTRAIYLPVVYTVPKSFRTASVPLVVLARVGDLIRLAVFDCVHCVFDWRLGSCCVSGHRLLRRCLLLVVTGILGAFVLCLALTTF